MGFCSETAATAQSLVLGNRAFQDCRTLRDMILLVRFAKFTGYLNACIVNKKIVIRSVRLQ